MSGEVDPLNQIEHVVPSEQSLVIPDRHQAIFKKDGSAYFGKLWVLPTVYMISDVYFYSSPDFSSITRLEHLPHRPENVMHIPRENVDYWENLQEDSPVTSAIAEYKQQLGQ